MCMQQDEHACTARCIRMLWPLKYSFIMMCTKQEFSARWTRNTFAQKVATFWELCGRSCERSRKINYGSFNRRALLSFSIRQAKSGVARWGAHQTTSCRVLYYTNIFHHHLWLDTHLITLPARDGKFVRSCLHDVSVRAAGVVRQKATMMHTPPRVFISYLLYGTTHRQTKYIYKHTHSGCFSLCWWAVFFWPPFLFIP